MEGNKQIHIVFFKGILETLDYFVEKLVDAAVANNIDYYVADTENVESYSSSAFFDFIKQENSILITFNQIGTRLVNSSEENVWEKYNVQIYDILVDHPRNFRGAFIEPLTCLNVLCIDKDHVRYIREFYPKVGKVAFLGHGGAQEDVVDYDSREYQVLYVGDCQQKISDFPVIDGLEDGGMNLYSRVIQEMMIDCNLTAEAAIRSYLDECGVECNLERIYYIYNIAAPHVENYIRRHYKQLCMRELDKLGVVVDVYGKNWEDDEYQYGPNIRLHSRVSSRECNYMAGNAKICLNFMPWFKDGTTERVFNAMLNKSVCVSDKSSVLETIFTDGENIVFYDLNNPLQMAYDVKFLLEHPDVAKYIANNGYNIASHKCTWENRLKDIILMHQNGV